MLSPAAAGIFTSSWRVVVQAVGFVVRSDTWQSPPQPQPATEQPMTEKPKRAPSRTSEWTDGEDGGGKAAISPPQQDVRDKGAAKQQEKPDVPSKRDAKQNGKQQQQTQQQQTQQQQTAADAAATETAGAATRATAAAGSAAATAGGKRGTT
ncbi:unnamed protein product [Acanthosepion pharaonis]|uniref:Uncharacterized protein n=1 Tax=Acanthosepion pharaonis TaxID=158019 RepID=A0A812CXJ5_ACAPH|nr:unnamed protein product [Sepia pharaonis]